MTSPCFEGFGTESMDDVPFSNGKSRGYEKWVEEIQEVFRLLSSGESIQLVGTQGPSRTLIAYGLSILFQSPVILMVPDLKTRHRVEGELNAIAEMVGPPFTLSDPPEKMVLPSWELTPYVDEWLRPRVSSARVRALYALLSTRPVTLLTTPEALVNRLVKWESFKSGVFTLKPAVVLEMEGLFWELIKRGYSRTVSTELPGDFSVRGGIVDLFSPLEEAPVRIEFEGDELVSLRYFDPVSQRTTKHVPHAVVSPAQELYPQAPFPDIQKKLYALQVSREGKVLIRRFLKSLEKGETFEKWLWLSPYLYDLEADIFSYLPPNTPILAWDPEVCQGNLLKSLDMALRQYDRVKSDFSILPDPDALFIPFEEFVSKLASHPRLDFGLSIHERGKFLARPSFKGKAFWLGEIKRGREASRPLSRVIQEALRLYHKGYEIWIAEPSEKDRRALQESLAAKGLPLPVLPSLSFKTGRGGILPVNLPEGCVFPNLKLAILSRSHSWTPTSRRGTRGAGLRLSEITTFQEGDPLVHLDYGIGLYRGLKHVEVLDRRGEFLEMEYAKGDKLLVPIDSLDRVQRYVGSGDAPPPLDALGSTSWARRKARLRMDVAKMAKDLLELYALRKTVKGYAFNQVTEGLAEFEASFPYQETPDQRKAIEDIFRDMTSDVPMDRLVCGDVGFGKTEVAMRAAFKAAMEGKQVAVLVPTTVLAEQHYINFLERFSPYPLKVELLSRFRSQSAIKSVLTGLSRGTVDIVVGTHRLLQKDVKFKDLGLLIVDEEHRFGVTHKELLKKLSNTVDVLTLSATPIPRTLQMSLTGFRDLSLINTPPRARLPVITKIARFEKETIIEGIERELSRGGQVFFIHNRIKSISKMTNLIRNLVPSAVVTFAHGQMDEKALEDVMLAFLHREIDVLVCTTIIESGVDIPNVNTLFVHHAEQFGLSTLYQLRGRIGRSDRQAFAYFLIPHRAILPKQAIKRLQSLQEFSNLGSGFRLSLMDLNLRGGGDLLGRRQSGRIAEVGFELYTRIVEEEVKKLKGEWREPNEPIELKLPFPTLLPDEYIPDMGLRLSFYRRLSGIEDPGEVSEIEEELLDRFGSLPSEAQNLLNAIRLKIHLTACGVASLYGKDHELVLSFTKTCPLNHQRLISLLQEDPSHYKLTTSQKLIIRAAFPANFCQYVEKIYAVLKQLVACDKIFHSKREGEKASTQVES